MKNKTEMKNPDVIKLGIAGFYFTTRRISKNAWDITKEQFGIEDKQLIDCQTLFIETKAGEL
jgi:hypothetical protein